MYYRDLNGMSKAGKRHGRVVGCDFVTTWSREIDGDHFLEVEAGTNGYQEEEEENGCGVYLSLRDLDGKGIHVLTGREDCKRVDTDELLFLLRGNRQLNSVKEALRWMLSILEVQSEGVESVILFNFTDESLFMFFPPCFLYTCIGWPHGMDVPVNFPVCLLVVFPEKVHVYDDFACDRICITDFDRARGRCNIMSWFFYHRKFMIRQSTS